MHNGGMEKSCVLLAVLCLLQLFTVENATKTVPSVTLDIPLDFNQPVKSYDDFVKIVATPCKTQPSFEIVLNYRTKDKRLLTLEVTSTGVLNSQRTEFKYDVAIAHRTEVTQTLSIKVHLRDSLVYLENKALNLFPDLFIEEIQITAMLLDLSPDGLDFKPVLAGDFKRLPLTPPWSRPSKPGFSFKWPWKHVMRRKQKIDKCQSLNDIIDLITFPVALTGKETGVKRTLPPLAWPREELAEEHNRAKPRFTISTWIFMMEPCVNGLCGILNHRSTELLTPLLSITSTGHLHVQVQYSADTGHAFVISNNLPLKKWIQIVMSVDDTTFYITTRQYNGPVFDKEENALHNHFPRGSFQFKDTEGYWVLGGSEGSRTFKGFIGHTRIYRRHLLFPNQVFLPSQGHVMFRMALMDDSVKCSERIMTLREATLEKMQMASEQNEHCVAGRRSLLDLTTLHNSTVRQCDVPLSGETPDVDEIVQQAISHDHNNMISVANSLYQLANEKLENDVRKTPNVLSILRVASCMGHSKSQYAAGIMNLIGLGVPQDITQGWKYLLLGAANDNALCQMALAYRHLIGADGLRQDCDVAIGYYKAAALTSDKLLQQHQDVNTHAEAVRLDDYDELAKHKIDESDLFQWLTHQTWYSLTDAQSLLADLYYYGKRNLQRDLDRAVKYYQMGADKGDPEGLYNLGISMLRGDGIEQNETEAIKLIHLSAEQGFPPALNALGFYEGNMRQNHSGAAVYFRRAANKGDRDGLSNLAVSYDNGWVEGHPPDKKEAFKYWFEAATRGHPGSCLTVGEGVSSGVYVEKNCPLGVVYLRFVAEQNPEVGRFMRKGLKAYYSGDTYKSFVNFVFAAEVGMELPLYNAGLLCEENQEEVEDVTSVDCTWHYYNRSAAMGWVFAMVKVGDNHWYGKSVPKNITFAGEMYSRAAAKNGLPQAMYNLAYMVEYNYSLNGIHWNNQDKDDILQGNLAFAASLYEKCRDAQENNNESFLPCAFGVIRVKLKIFWQDRTITALTGAGILTFIVGMSTMWFFFSNNL